MPKLVFPNMSHKESYAAALREGFVRGDDAPMTENEIQEIEADFAAYLESRKSKVGDITCPDGVTRALVPDMTLWLTKDDHFIGEVSLRLELNDFLESYGGHVGYGIRPSEKRKGYGTLALKLCFSYARDAGLKKLLLTCDPENIGSRRIIESNGGVLQDTVEFDWVEEKVARYWITL